MSNAVKVGYVEVLRLIPASRRGEFAFRLVEGGYRRVRVLSVPEEGDFNPFEAGQRVWFFPGDDREPAHLRIGASLIDVEVQVSLDI